MEDVKNYLKNKHKKFIDCNFNIKEFNKTKRSKKFIEELNVLEAASGKGRGKPKPPTTSVVVSVAPPPPPVNTVNCIYLAFNGGTVANTNWNYTPIITCLPSGLSEGEKDIIIASVTEDYAPFDVVVTTDEAFYNTCANSRKVRCLITETHEWYGNGAGGVAFVGSFNSPTEDPCFVFSSLLGYNTKLIMEAISHEVGHTLGCYHQSTYDSACALVREYNNGGNGEAPIMGVSYYQPVGKWWIGPTTTCTTIQDDKLKISAILPLK